MGLLIHKKETRDFDVKEEIDILDDSTFLHDDGEKEEVDIVGDREEEKVDIIIGDIINSRIKDVDGKNFQKKLRIF